MPKNLAVFSCLIISPSDVTEARDAAVKAIENWNAHVGAGLHVRIDPIRWESHARPEMGAPGQDLINQQLVDKCDFGIAIFWSRLGSPTASHPSGSAEEVDRLLLRGCKVMVYFSRQPIPQEALTDDQFARLQEIKKRYEKNGLVGTFDSLPILREQLQLHLTNLVNELLSKAIVDGQWMPSDGTQNPSMASVSPTSTQGTVVSMGRGLVAPTHFSAVSSSTLNNAVVSMPTTVDIAIITILPEEYNAVRRRLKNVRRDPGTKESPNQYAWVVGEIDSTSGRPYRVVLAMTVHAGNVSSSLGISRTVARWNPRYVLLVGIAGGLPRDNLTLGDAVISTQVCSYEYGKIAHNAFNPRPNFLYQVDGALLRNAVSLSHDTDWHKELIPRPVEGGPPRVSHGMVGSGEKVVDDRSAAFFAAVEKVFPKLQAVEMEGAGAAAAIEECQAASQVIGFLMIRGISDIPPKHANAVASNRTDTGGNDRDNWKKYAADVAASFTIYFIATAWPMPPENSGSSVPTGLLVHGQPDSGSAIAIGVGPTTADVVGAVRSTLVTIPGASDRARKIASERPRYWEVRLFSQALSDELAASSAARRDMELGVSFGAVESREPVDALSWASTQLAFVVRIAEILANLVNIGLQEAMGAPGEPGDPQKIVYVANRIGQGYREAIAWTLRWRSLHTDAVFGRIIDLGQSAGVRMVSQLEEWNGRIARTLRETVEAGKFPAAGSVVDLSAKIDLPDRWNDNLAIEIRRLERHFGVDVDYDLT